MSEGDDETAAGDASEDAVSARERVVGALEGLFERMDTLRGVAVCHPRESGGERARDPSTVEVRFYLPERHPREADRALGMLQGRDFDVTRERRGGDESVCIRLVVDVSGAGNAGREPRGEWSEDGPAPSEQDTF